MAFLYGNAQGSQSLEPQLPGRVVASYAVRSNLGVGTNESEGWVLIRDLLPIFQGPVVFLASQELGGSLQVRFVARQAFATGFGKAPLAGDLPALRYWLHGEPVAPPWSQSLSPWGSSSRAGARYVLGGPALGSR